jgi:hypothetical protein
MTVRLIRFWITMTPGSARTIYWVFALMVSSASSNSSYSSISLPVLSLDLFINTKMDLGPCSKFHTEEFKFAFENNVKDLIYYENILEKEILFYLSEADKKIKVNNLTLFLTRTLLPHRERGRDWRVTTREMFKQKQIPRS